MEQRRADGDRDLWARVEAIEKHIAESDLKQQEDEQWKVGAKAICWFVVTGLGILSVIVSIVAGILGAFQQ